MPVTVHLTPVGTGNTVIANFAYDRQVVEVIRDIPGREFKPAQRIWTFPATWENVLQLKERLAALGCALSLPPQLREKLNAEYNAHKEAGAIRAAGDANIDFTYLTEPYAHQRAGLAFLARLGSGALFWEMGLGKTKTAVDYAEWLGRGPLEQTGNGTALGGSAQLRVLVICPNTVKRNWAAEVRKHAGHDDVVVPTGHIEKKRIPALGTARYTIVNCEALSHAHMAAALIGYPWDLVIVDESTRFKTPKAQRTKALQKLGRNVKRRVILTGTPITGKPEDAWSQLEFVRPGIFGKSFWAFADRYLAKDWFGNVVGIKPGMADELKGRIDSVSYRILKEQVLDLPPKVYSDRTVEMTGEQARAYRQMRDELRIEIEGKDEVTAANILVLLLRLTQVTAGLIGQGDQYTFLPDNAKVTELDHLLNEELAGEQVVIFGLYQKELEALAARYAREDPVLNGSRPARSAGDLPIIYGPTPEAVRQQLIDDFQRGDRRLLFVQSRTGGIGITLTAAKTAIYYTRGWGLEEYLQSQDRLHRIGQTGTVSIIHLVAEESIDQEIADALAEKQSIADHLTGDGARKLAARILGK